MSDPYSRTPDVPPRRSTRSVRWAALAMAASWIIGVLWIVMYYLDPALPVLGDLGNWNLLAGFGLLLLGAVFGVILLVVLVVSAPRRP
ncbi:cell division protein CrgA [Nonomuraea guangzhouensis]|uniref:Cell division protein CrgA n=1 Tax=Nonomuraea guangzhouensis TaxID=1291555 RepID=A0ABW4GGX7_9ACTN|nr:cell division protein CrgA [Nonomuraea guangzhouensis]